MRRIAEATGISAATIPITFEGLRYRKGEARVSVPSDRIIVKIASVIGMTPEQLHAVDRQRAADMLEEALQQRETVTPADEQSTLATIAYLISSPYV